MSFPSAVLRSFVAVVAAILLLAGSAIPAMAGPAVIARTETAAPPAASASSSTGVGIRLLDIPTDNRDDPRAQSYIVDHVRPGTTIERRIEVTNQSSAPQSVRIYAAAARIVDGSFEPYDQSPNELSTWIETDPEQVQLAAQEQSEVVVSIRVPEDAPEGEQYAAVWAEVRSSEEKQGEVAMAQRAGIRVYLSVGPGNGPAADFSIGTLAGGRDEHGNPVVTAEVTNTGGRAVDLTGDLALTGGPGGVSAGPFTAEGGSTIAPKGTGQVHIVLDPELPNGPWTGELELTSGLLTRDATAELTFPEAGQSTQAEAGISPWWWPTAALVLALIILFIILRRHRARATTAATTQE